MGGTPADEIKISVCMAACNGGRFIGEQIASILPQLASHDEFIIVDDASVDNTVGVIESFRDSRIRVIHHTAQRGVVASFGRALEEAKGEIVFLTDQDDLWRADKVKRFLGVFSKHSDVTVVTSDLVIIDAAGRVCSGPRFGKSRFCAGIFQNLVRNRYQGSAMAFRRRILKYCLPFPEDIPIHDVWIGLVNQFVGRAAFIPEPLLLYRRHGSNESPDRHAPVPQMLRWRWALTKNLAVLYLQKLAWRHPR